MYRYLMLLLALTVSTATWAQQAPDYTKRGDSDPKAKAILKKLRTKYNGYNSLQADFKLLIEDGDDTYKQSGKMWQRGEQYRLELDDNEIVSDGTTLWVYMKQNDQIQITDAEAEEDDPESLSPKKLLSLYESDEFVFAYAGERKRQGKVYQYIEFKPLDRDSEYYKVRLTVDKAAQLPYQIKVFSRDGSRYTMTLERMTPNPEIAGNKFTFDTTKYPNALVEDLRL